VQTKEDKLETNPQPKETASLWRYGLISELLHRNSQGTPLAERLKEASERTWNHPTKGLVQLKGDTLRHWMYRYRKGGIRSLEDRPRRDKGVTLVPKALAEKLMALRNEYPHATTERLLHMLIQSGDWNAIKPSRSAFYRFAKLNDLKRKPTGSSKVQEAHAFAYDAFGQMWIADFLHGPKIREGRQMRKTYLLAIIDDATRYIVYAYFGYSEGIAALIAGLSMAITRFGVPERFYTDNGSAFRSRHLAHVAAKLGIHLPHTPAYRPQGRGKVERFFRTVRDQCLTGLTPVSLEGLQKAFNEWLEEYHHRIHDGIDASPLNKRLAAQRVTRMLPEVTQVDMFFGMTERRKIHRDGTLRLLGKTFDVKGALPGSVVEVSYLPWDLTLIHVGPERIPAKQIDLGNNARRFENNPIRGKENMK
jgi:putative transposase